MPTDTSLKWFAPLIVGTKPIQIGVGVFRTRFCCLRIVSACHLLKYIFIILHVYVRISVYMIPFKLFTCYIMYLHTPRATGQTLTAIYADVTGNCNAPTAESSSCNMAKTAARFSGYITIIIQTNRWEGEGLYIQRTFVMSRIVKQSAGWKQF